MRRYLAAYGPASAADVTAWSGVPGIPAVLASMDDLVRHTDAAGKKLVDLPSGAIADPEVPGARSAARPLRQRLALPRRP